jgi:two-component system response regulator (stage 0 sporulation protein A)
MINVNKMDFFMKQLGHPEHLTGTEYLRAGIEIAAADREARISKDIYPEVARRYHTTPSRVERCMRHSIETAFERGDRETIDDIFGYAIAVDTGRPTVGQYLKTMARVCRAD